MVSSSVKGRSVVGRLWSHAFTVAMGIISLACRGWGERAQALSCAQTTWTAVEGAECAGLEPPRKIQMRAPEEGRMGV